MGSFIKIFVMAGYGEKLTFSTFLTNKSSAFSQNTKECLKKINYTGESILFAMKANVESTLLSSVNQESLYQMLYSLVNIRENCFMKMLHRLATIILVQEKLIVDLKAENQRIQMQLQEKYHHDHQIIQRKRQKKQLKIIRRSAPVTMLLPPLRPYNRVNRIVSIEPMRMQNWQQLT